MSLIAAVGMAIGVVGTVCLLWKGLTFMECLGPPPTNPGEWPWDTFARWHEQKPEKKEKGPEPGTIRIVEKMDTDGELYYVAERWESERHERTRSHSWPALPTYKTWYTWTWHPFPSPARGYATPEEAQQAANDETDRRKAENEVNAEMARRAAHHEVVGKFKP